MNESHAFIAGDASNEFVETVEAALGVETTLLTIAGSFVIGSLMAINSNGAVVSGLTEEGEVKKIGEFAKCIRVDDPLNAAGNNILVNNHGAIVNPDYPDDVIRSISDALGVECVPATIADCKTVGSICSATNKGCVCHIDATDDEVELIKDVLKVEAVRSSVNHGSRMVGAGILSNSKGAVVGDDTTPIEMGRIEEGLALY